MWGSMSRLRSGHFGEPRHDMPRLHLAATELHLTAENRARSETFPRPARLVAALQEGFGGGREGVGGEVGIGQGEL
jgi:hypothetical protein